MYSYTTKLTLVHALALHYDASSSICSTTRSHVGVCARARQRHKALATYCLLRSYARQLADALIIDALIAGRKIFAASH